MPPSAPARRRRTQAERRDESHRQLVEAMLRIVAERGVSAATFDEIGREAGYSRGLVSQRFGSKRGLIDALIAYLQNGRHAVTEAEHFADMTAIEVIVAYVDLQLRAISREQGGQAYFMLLADAVADATAMREAFAASHERIRTWLRELIERGQAQGDIRRDIDADATALMIGSQILGVNMQWLADPGTRLDAIRAQALASLKRTLQPDGR